MGREGRKTKEDHKKEKRKRWNAIVEDIQRSTLTFKCIYMDMHHFGRWCGGNRVWVYDYSIRPAVSGTQQTQLPQTPFLLHYISAVQ